MNTPAATTLQTLRAAPLAAALAACALLLSAGCATTRYACGAPDGTTCASARDVYRLTEASDRVQPAPRDGRRSAERQPDREYGAPSRQPPARAGVVIEQGALAFATTDNAAAPGGSLLGAAPAPTGPVRLPPRVMRVWINAWEDEAGDLHSAASVYAEIEPRRWSIGTRGPGAGATLRLMEPLGDSRGGRAAANPLLARPGEEPQPQQPARTSGG